MSWTTRLLRLIRPVAGTSVAVLCGWAATYALDPERTTIFDGSGSQRRMFGTFNVFVEAPAETESRERFRTVPYEELDAFLRDNPKYRVRTDPGKECFPIQPTGDGTQTCVAARGNPDEQVLEVHQVVGGDISQRSIYRVRPSGVTRISHHFVHGMDVFGGLMGIFLAGFIGLALGLKLGAKLNGIVTERLTKSVRAASY